MLSRIKRAIEYANFTIACREEAAVHYGETFPMWDRWLCWRNGFVSGWKGEEYPDVQPAFEIETESQLEFFEKKHGIFFQGYRDKFKKIR